MKNTTTTICTAVLLTLSLSVHAENPSAEQISAAVTKSVTSQPEKVTDIVFSHISKNDASACEVVKAAIVASGANKDLVAEIVEAATEAAPDKVRIIGQCAVAVAPDAIAKVQAIVVKYAATSGGASDYSGSKQGVGDSKGALGALSALPGIPASPVSLEVPTNALNFPGQGPVGPTPGGPGGFPLFPPGLQPPVVSTSGDISEGDLFR